MPHKDFPNIQDILDEVFSAAEEIRQAVSNEFGFGEAGKGMDWFEYKDYYPGYSYPPLNVFLTADKSMVFQFALAGFSEKDINLEFRGDYMIFSATAPEHFEPSENVRYFKRRLKLKSIPEQKYFVPADKFDQDKVKAVLKNAILTVNVPAKEIVREADGKTINIEIDPEEEVSAADPAEA